MAKVFSVEWMSQSIHSTDSDKSKDKEIFIKPCLPCATSNYLDMSVAPKISLTTEKEPKEAPKAYSPSSPTDSCGYTSGSESEVGEDSEGESGSHRRLRTKFTSDQLYRLEKVFNKHRYLGATQRRNIAEKLQLSETQVKTWFQNRRMKLKREMQDVRAEHFCPSMSLTMPSPSAPLTQYSYGPQYGQLTTVPRALYGPLVPQVTCQQTYPFAIPRQYYWH